MANRLASLLIPVLAVILGWSAAEVPAGQGELRAILRFAAEVAEKGDWREARYRWEQAIKIEPDRPRILNNLAVSLEALGDPAGARKLYEKAISLSEGDEEIVENLERAARFWRAVNPATAGAGPQELKPQVETPSRRSRGRGGAVRVPVRLPVPPRLDLSSAKTLLVASFLGNETEILDNAREVVRYLRGEFRKRGTIKVLDVTPPPAVPEQTVEDLVANAQFWKYLGREHGADLIVSGVVRFGRRDASGFEDVDAVSSVTGQKVRQTRWVEQERFNYELEVFFLDGATGELRFRDRFHQTALYRGQANDPITAFYEISDSIAADVVAVIAPRTHEDTRVIFRD